MKCYVCDKDITPETETDEHIIINAAGGRLKSKKLICVTCNSRFGQEIDSVLAKQLNSLANMLMIKRHRGEPQPILGDKESTGEQYLLEVGGKPRLSKPIVTKRTEAEKTSISVRARSEKELREILKGIAKKHPHFDVEEAMKSATWRNEYFSEPISVDTEVGGKEVFRAVCKCATNFFIYLNGDVLQIKHLIPFIEGLEERDIVWMHYQDDLYELNSNECFHLIHLIGKEKEGILYCYVDYFNTYKYLVLLNDNYKGVEINQSYCFDLINVVPIERTSKIDYDKQTLLKFFTHKDSKPFERVKKSFDHSLAIGIKRQDEFQRGQILERAIQNSLGKYPEGTNITEQMLDEVINEIAETIVPYLLKEPKQT